ncbi:MAG: hypothetical protein FWF08_02025 [Oscillospiraceae bacterium]|nr:hypothetical protein [Oscillospiraceae bacterium]
MNDISKVCFFAGANSPEGFYSLFSDIYDPLDGWELYIIKGGPGTGKSSSMGRMAEKIEKEGYSCERILCSMDSGSLDAVIFPGLKRPFATAPPRTPSNRSLWA